MAVFCLGSDWCLCLLDSWFIVSWSEEPDLSVSISFLIVDWYFAFFEQLWLAFPGSCQLQWGNTFIVLMIHMLKWCASEFTQKCQCIPRRDTIGEDRSHNSQCSQWNPALASWNLEYSNGTVFNEKYVLTACSICKYLSCI